MGEELFFFFGDAVGNLESFWEQISIYTEDWTRIYNNDQTSP